MTQVQEWSNAELNRKLAELMGYTVIQSHDAKEGGGAPLYQLTGPGFTGRYDRKPENTWKSVPNWSSDPAASLEVQTAAIEKSQVDYLLNLSKVTNPNADDFAPWTPTEIIKLLTASPRERAEAAYITLSSKQ
ncbi:hypothetical protein KDC22_14340 [Paenibacillus tritici]|uniref:hypothetical protein n=1 Tax=Paenibacillus tritici TaxID=1873425 RepID=UPI001BACFDEE|nr:hypothetical protein [Paenibacillus tritici]QUL57545.1 hypothetical protein KDC22_14340 [Paenibacillus tritici]